MTASTARPDGLMDYDEAIERFDPVLGLEVHVELGTATKMFCALPDRVRCAAEHPGLPGLPGAARRDAGDQPHRGRVRDPDRPGAELHDRALVPVRPEELLLPGHAEELPDLAVRRADRLRRLPRRRGRRRDRADRDRARAHGGGHRQVPPRRRRDRPDLTAPSTRCWTTTGPACRWSRSSPRPIVGTKASAPAVARAYVTALRDLLKSLGVSDVRMDQGSLRCDANLSLTPAGNPVLGTRTETKNVNSLRSVERAVRYEITRQAAVLAAGGRIKQETRHFDESTGTTVVRAGRRRPPRTTGTSPSRTWCRWPRTPEWVEQIRAALPEFPWLRRNRLQADWGLTDLEMRDLVAADAVELVAATVEAGASPAEARSWWASYLGPAGQHPRRGAGRAADHPGAAGRRHRQGVVRCADHQDGPAGRRRRAGRRGRARTR